MREDSEHQLSESVKNSTPMLQFPFLVILLQLSPSILREHDKFVVFLLLHYLINLFFSRFSKEFTIHRANRPLELIHDSS